MLVRRMMYAALLSRWARRVARRLKAAVPPIRFSLRFEAHAAMQREAMSVCVPVLGRLAASLTMYATRACSYALVRLRVSREGTRRPL